MKRPIVLALAFIVAAFAVIAQAHVPKATYTITGKVVAIVDGDTLTILDSDNTQHKIRLNGIDAPERRQAFGSAARRALADRVFGAAVSVRWSTKDRYGRIVGDVYRDGQWINQAMVQGGMAWHYRKYSKSVDLAEAERSARARKAGLWRDATPVAPWDYRRKPSGPAEKGTAATVVYTTRTGSKYHRAGCRQLSKSKIETTLGKAAAKFGPCGVCKPPVLEAK